MAKIFLEMEDKKITSKSEGTGLEITAMLAAFIKDVAEKNGFSPKFYLIQINSFINTMSEKTTE